MGKDQVRRKLRKSNFTNSLIREPGGLWDTYPPKNTQHLGINQWEDAKEKDCTVITNSVKRLDKHELHAKCICEQLPWGYQIPPPTQEDKTMFRNEDSVLGSKKLSPNQFLNLAQVATLVITQTYHLHGTAKVYKQIRLLKMRPINHLSGFTRGAGHGGAYPE